MSFPRYKLWLLIGAISGFLAVALGAFGAHGLEGLFESQSMSAADVAKRLEDWETAARYQMYHALALLAVGFVTARRCTWTVNLAGIALLLGTALFSGCLYAWVLGGPKVLVHFVPIGGTLLLLGWLLLAAAVALLPPAQGESISPSNAR